MPLANLRGPAEDLPVLWARGFDPQVQHEFTHVPFCSTIPISRHASSPTPSPGPDPSLLRRSIPAPAYLSNLRDPTDPALAVALQLRLT